MDHPSWRGGRVRKVYSAVAASARQMRVEPTVVEAVLWRELRNRKLAGLKFRRQHPVGQFVLDFYCAERRLVIELDGGVHEQRQARDAERTAYLEATGLHVLRFRNEEILNDLPSVLEKLRFFRGMPPLGPVPPLPEMREGARG